MATMTPTVDTGQIGERLLALVRPYRAFNQMVRRDIETLFAHPPALAETIATEAMIAGLPTPVQRYLRYAGVLGKPLARSVYVEQRGTMRSSAQAAWQPFDARQFISVQPPGFVRSEAVVI